MGSARFYAEERPVHRRRVEAFEIDRHPVTVAQFRRFVAATGHVTTAERAPDAADYPDALPELLVPGAMVFTPPAHPVPLHDPGAWWSWVPGASWRQPQGPGSTVPGEDHPVTQVSYDDASAYAAWAGLSLPTEAEWEHAARGGLVQATYAWGEEAMPGGRVLANTWHGQFPHQNRAPDGHTGTSPIGSYPANGYGLHDMCGNVWEWTSDVWTPDHSAAARTGPATAVAAATPSCCAPPAPRAPLPEPPAAHVVKGGSHLCAPSYCLRYRPAARQAQTTDAATTHLGFRCVRRPASRATSHGATVFLSLEPRPAPPKREQP
ncbi:formylglycine-generating enzyme family protein [Nocardioides sp. zg-536]|uniref:Formylglycine-generating enzyme family protein n=2 Tax=Nocardioides faecalis TaxID=2803858 RepID=A0A939BSR2_9ACTN|nr:formylglycine-generating enzyme family protein [Nocardioides faecalis]QVI60380.1 formylglycine-generating enzyme family protein [Nocardioides faecalis]